MTKKQVVKTMNRVRGMLMHLSMLVQDSETKGSIRKTLDEIDDIDELMGLSERHSDDDEEDGEE